MSKKDIDFKNGGIFPDKEAEWFEEESVIPLNERSIGIQFDKEKLNIKSITIDLDSKGTVFYQKIKHN